MLAGFLLAGLLAACSENSSPAPAPTPIQTTGAGPVSTAQAGVPTPTRAAGPVVGANGQITVVAPPPTGEGIGGQMFWVKENNLWQNGANISGARPLTVKDLGGKQLTKASALAIARSPAVSPDGGKVAYAFSPEPETINGTITI